MRGRGGQKNVKHDPSLYHFYSGKDYLCIIWKKRKGGSTKGQSHKKKSRKAKDHGKAGAVLQINKRSK